VIDRYLNKILLQRLNQNPVVALLGSRQVGKTTLARGLELQKPIHYMDLERSSDLAKLEDPELYLSRFPGHLIILDEIQRLPTLFPLLRSLVDARRQSGEPHAQFLLLGSASRALLQASSESLAGRISYLELPPFLLPELDPHPSTLERHWHRGGYPDSYLAPNDATSLQWRSDFLTTYTEAYLPQQGVQSSPQQLRRLCSMLAHQQGATLNLSRLGASLALDGKTVRHYIDLLEGLFLLRTLPPWGRNAGKRLVQSPKLYWRDCRPWSTSWDTRSAAIPGRAIASSKSSPSCRPTRAPATTEPMRARRST